MKLLKYALVLLIAFSAISCIDEQVKPVLQDEDTPALHRNHPRANLILYERR